MSDETNASPKDEPAQTPGECADRAGEPNPCEKPPTQAFSPTGTDFTSVAVKEKSAREIFSRLPAHPPFQMFIEEIEPNQGGINSMQYAKERGLAAIGHMGADAFIASYVDWWTAKAYWHGEDPFGTVPSASERL